MIKPITVELSGHIKSQLPIETFSAFVSLDDLKSKALASGILRRTNRGHAQTRRHSLASVANPGSAAYQIPLGVPRRHVPKRDDFTIVDGNEGRLGIKTSRAQRRLERVCIFGIASKTEKSPARPLNRMKINFPMVAVPGTDKTEEGSEMRINLQKIEDLGTSIEAIHHHARIISDLSLTVYVRVWEAILSPEWLTTMNIMRREDLVMPLQRRARALGSLKN